MKVTKVRVEWPNAPLTGLLPPTSQFNSAHCTVHDDFNTCLFLIASHQEVNDITILFHRHRKTLNLLNSSNFRETPPVSMRPNLLLWLTYMGYRPVFWYCLQVVIFKELVPHLVLKFCSSEICWCFLTLECDMFSGFCRPKTLLKISPQ
jgi:hypothetical protein